MTHEYINIDKLYDFSEVLSLEDVFKDITIKYNVTNLNYADEDSMFLLIGTLYSDYENHYINYRAFIEKGIDARLLFELRRNAFLKMPDMALFCNKHKNFNTVNEVISFRKQAIKTYLPEYEDLDWQYSLIIKNTWNIDIMDFYFDFDVCFNDRNSNYQRTPEDYQREFIESKMSFLQNTNN